MEGKHQYFRFSSLGSLILSDSADNCFEITILLSLQLGFLTFKINDPVAMKQNKANKKFSWSRFGLGDQEKDWISAWASELTG